jgi:hypothetical protein
MPKSALRAGNVSPAHHIEKIKNARDDKEQEEKNEQEAGASIFDFGFAVILTVGAGNLHKVINYLKLLDYFPLL